MRGGSVEFIYEYESPEADEDGEFSLILLDVTATVSDYDPGCMYLRNGDPGYPSEGGEVEDLEVTMPDESIMEPIPAGLLMILEGRAHEELVN